MDYIKTFYHFSKYPYMYIYVVNYNTVTSFMSGLDTGSDFKMLEGLKEWIYIRYDNISVNRGVVIQINEIYDSSNHEDLVGFYFEILKLFFNERENLGLEKIKKEYKSKRTIYWNDSNQDQNTSQP